MGNIEHLFSQEGTKDENHEVSYSNTAETLGVFFSFVLVGGIKYPVKLVEVHTNSSKHHGYTQKKERTKPTTKVKISIQTK